MICNNLGRILSITCIKTQATLATSYPPSLPPKTTYAWRLVLGLQTRTYLSIFEHCTNRRRTRQMLMQPGYGLRRKQETFCLPFPLPWYASLPKFTAEVLGFVLSLDDHTTYVYIYILHFYIPRYVYISPSHRL